MKKIRSNSEWAIQLSRPPGPDAGGEVVELGPEVPRRLAPVDPRGGGGGAAPSGEGAPSEEGAGCYRSY